MNELPAARNSDLAPGFEPLRVLFAVSALLIGLLVMWR